MKPALSRAVAPALLLCLLCPPAFADEVPGLAIYGFARLDLIIDDSPMSDVKGPFYVNPEPGDDIDNEFAMHPRLSRLGLDIEDFDIAGPLDGEGKIEVDFRHGGSESNPLMGLRHAYFKLKAGSKFEILGGHTWDLISPLFPAANADTMMWNAGNTGDRRPQLRFTGVPTDKTRFAFAIAQTGAVDGKDLDDDGTADGVAAGVPMLQWLIEHRMRMGGKHPLRIGLWGHLGSEELGDGTDYSTASVGAHLFLPLPGDVALLGEIYRGHNLSDIRGGIDQGINLATGEEIDSTGGWVEAVVVPNPRHMIAAGGTFDNPDHEDVADGGREKNYTFYLVHRYRPVQTIQLGFEYIRWFTGYKHAPDGTANRFDLHMAVMF